MLCDNEFLSIEQVLKEMKAAAENQAPFSLVRIGDGENIVLAQDSVWPLQQILDSEWGQYAVAEENSKGVTLPSLTLRDQMVEAIKKASVVGILPENDSRIFAPEDVKRPLTDQLFRYFDIKPQAVFDAYMTRLFPDREDFWDILRTRRIMIISVWAERLKRILVKPPYGLDVTITVPFSHYNQMEYTLAEIYNNKDNFDIALISCGVNAVVLAQRVAELTGKIGIDFGKSAQFMVQKKTGLHLR